MNQELKLVAKALLSKTYRKRLLERENQGRLINLQRSPISDKYVQIVIRDNCNVGLFSDYIVFLKEIDEAVQRNRMIIIDRKTVHNEFLPANHSTNTWEYFFEQPFNIDLSDIDDNMNIDVLHHIEGTSPISLLHCQDEDTITYWRSLARKYIRFQPSIQKELDSTITSLIGNNNVLGVAIREGYIKLNAENRAIIHNHPRQASVDEMLNAAEQYLLKWNCDKLFFTCQTKETADLFKAHFGDKAICTNRKRKTDTEIENLKGITPECAYENEKEYLREVYVLSQCRSMICCENSGSEAAFIMSHGFEHFKCFDFGRY